MTAIPSNSIQSTITYGPASAGLPHTRNDEEGG
jgi:hypothetical protein